MTSQHPARGRRVLPPARTGVLLILISVVAFVIRLDALRNVVPIDSPTVERALLCVLGAVTAGLVGLVARRVGGDVAGYVAATVVAVYPVLSDAGVDSLSTTMALAALAGGAVLVCAVVDALGSRRGQAVT